MFLHKRSDKLMDILGLIIGGGFTGSDGPHRFIGNNQRIQLV
jgi:hypothetical protein